MTSPSAPETGAKQSPETWRIWLIAAVVVYAVLFVALNRKTVHISFVFFSAQASLLVALLLAGALGFVAGWLVRRRQERGSGD
jgi:uncharacterized integral membrane protein